MSYRTTVVYDAAGRIDRVHMGLARKPAPTWAREAARKVELSGGLRVSRRDNFVTADGRVEQRKILTLRPDNQVVRPGEIHTVRAYDELGAEVSALVLVDRRFEDRTPVDITWANPARVRVELHPDVVADTAHPIRIIFRSDPGDKP